MTKQVQAKKSNGVSYEQRRAKRIQIIWVAISILLILSWVLTLVINI